MVGTSSTAILSQSLTEVLEAAPSRLAHLLSLLSFFFLLCVLKQSDKMGPKGLL